VDFLVLNRSKLRDIKSRFRNNASQKVEKLIHEEIKIIQNSNDKTDEKKLKLVKLREEIRNISWLPKGFKSSLNLQLVFSSAKIE